MVTLLPFYSNNDICLVWPMNCDDIINIYIIFLNIEMTEIWLIIEILGKRLGLFILHRQYSGYRWRGNTTLCWYIATYAFKSIDVFSCDQAALWMVQSVCLSVCLSVRLSVRLFVTPFWLCSHHRIIMKFSGVITSDKSDVHAKGQGQRSKVKVTEVTT